MITNPIINGHAVELCIDEPNRAVIATIRNCTDDAQDALFLRCGLSIYYPTTTPSVRDSIRLNASYRAVARCAPEDTFDAETGTQIAIDRLQKKYLDALSRRLQRAAAWIDDIRADIQSQADDALQTSNSIDPLAVLTGWSVEEESQTTDERAGE